MVAVTLRRLDIIINHSVQTRVVDVYQTSKSQCYSILRSKFLKIRRKNPNCTNAVTGRPWRNTRADIRHFSTISAAETSSGPRRDRLEMSVAGADVHIAEPPVLLFVINIKGARPNTVFHGAMVRLQLGW